MAALDDLASSVTCWQRGYLITADFSEMRKAWPQRAILLELKQFVRLKPTISALQKTIANLIKATSQMKY